MFPLITHFEELLKKIQPSQERLDAARDLPPLVRKYIAKSKDFPTVYPHSRLAGSYYCVNFDEICLFFVHANFVSM